MSLIDNGREIAQRMFEKHGLPVLITRATNTRTDADRAAGRKGTTVTATLNAKGVLGSRKLKNADGTYRREVTARLNAEVLPEDRVTIGTKTYTVVTVEETNPSGDAMGWTFLAGLK